MILYRGRLFQFALDARSSFSTPYANQLTQNGVLATFVKSCLWRVWDHFSFKLEHAPLVSDLLLGAGHPGGSEITAEAIKELEVQRGERQDQV